MGVPVACPNCGRENEPTARFCSACGTELGRVCPSCGTSNAPTASFCNACGTALVKPEARPEPAAERRVITVLFADLVGFTSRAERLDPEDVQSILSPYYARLKRDLEHFGGTVEKFIGDAVVALFGAPVAHGDDPERAVRAALAIRDAIGELNAADPELDLQLRIAVNTGEAIVALEGFSEGEGMAAGDVINTAARLQTAAPTNGILVGEETYRATHNAIEYQEIEPVEAKGKTNPVRAWVAVAAIGSTAERRTLRTPIVGRERELALLSGVWERVLDEQRPHFVTVLAPAGIGKTRLGIEFGRIVEASGARVVRGRSFPFGGSSPYGSFGSQVKQVAGIFDTDPIPAAVEKLEQTMTALLGAEEAPEVSAQVATLVGIEPGRAAADRGVAFFAARRLVEALGRDRPTLLVFEDIHWAEPGMLDLLETLASRLRDVPVLVIALARPELLTDRPGWGGGLPSYTALPLEPLGEDASRKLAQVLLGDGSDAADRLTETAEGNPLFLEELAASVVEGAARPDKLPTNVRGIISARLDMLPPDERALALDAAVIGKVFWRGALARAHGSNVDELLDRLEERDLVRREQVSRIRGEQQFAFKHMLIREVAYATLPRAARRVRHADVARFLEEAAGERANDWASSLVHHWREAGDPEQELRYLRIAAGQGWAADALPLYKRALELVPEDDVPQRRQVRLARAVALVDASLHAEAIEELDALLPEVEGRRRFDALSARGRASFWLGDAEGAHLYWGQARALAEQLGDDELEAAALALLSIAGAMDGDVEEAARLNERALEMWVPGARPRDFAEAQTWRSIQSYWTGRYERAIDAGRWAAELAEETAYAEGLISGPAHQGLALAGLGRHEEALTIMERAATDGANLELKPRFTSRATAMWAGVLRELYEIDESRRLNERAIELGVEASFPGAQVSGKIDLLVTDLITGDLGRAETAWPALWEAAVAMKGWHQWLWMMRLRYAKAEIELAAGRPEESAATAREAVETAERFSRVKYAVASRVVLGSALVELGRAPEAVEQLTRAVADAERLRHPPSVWTASAVLARACELNGSDDGADAALAAAQDAVEKFAQTLSAARRQRFLASPYLQARLGAVRR